MIARWWILWVLAGIGLPRAGAHQELYHNIDVDLAETAETGVVKISITIHAPELLVGSLEAADAMFDSRWLGKQTDEELARIVELARVFLAERFELHVDGGDLVDLGGKVTFEDFDLMRSAGGRELPPACILATLELAPPQGARRLQVEHAPESGKRLMLTVYRPGTFPGVIDVEPGSSAAVDLPAAPVLPEGRTTNRGAICVTAVVAGLLVSGFLLARWMRRRARSQCAG